MNVLLTEHIHPLAYEKLSLYANIINNLDNIEDADAIILRNITIDSNIIQKAKNLKVIGKHGIGCNTIDLDTAKKYNIKVINTPTANTDSVVELVLGLFIMLSRRLHEANNKCRNDEFTEIPVKNFAGTELNGKTLGIIGGGNIGLKLAKIFKVAFNCNVYCFDPNLTTDQLATFDINKATSIKDLLSQSDFVNVSVPLNNSTKNLISGEIFDYFKPSAILVNASRGGIVNEEVLYGALVSNKLKAAACDAFVIEPPTRKQKLLSLNNFSATPHIGGNTEESLLRTGMEVVDNVINILEGKEASGYVVK